MKIRCKCGNVIPDQTDDLPYKAHFVSDQQWGKSLDRTTTGIGDLARSINEGTVDEWRISQLGKDYPPDSGVNTLVADFIIRNLFSAFSTMYVCGKCGRLCLQMKSDAYTFVPESGKAALRSFEE